MDHEAYEKQMIDGVNRHAEVSSVETSTVDSTLNESDVRTIGRGLRRLVLAVLTVFLFSASVYFFVTVGTLTGYWAVLRFLLAIWAMFAAVVFLYALGITPMGRRGDSK